MNKVIAVDFDGTLCVSQWPEIGEENYGLIEWLKECRSKGDKVILFTCREDDLLDAEEDMQKLTDKAVKDVDDIFAKKEKEIMEV